MRRGKRGKRGGVQGGGNKRGGRGQGRAGMEREEKGGRRRRKGRRNGGGGENQERGSGGRKQERREWRGETRQIRRESRCTLPGCCMGDYNDPSAHHECNSCFLTR